MCSCIMASFTKTDWMPICQLTIYIPAGVYYTLSEHSVWLVSFVVQIMLILDYTVSVAEDSGHKVGTY